MAQNNSSTINFTTTQLKDIKSFCKLNELDFEEFVMECFNQGYQIEKYGLLNADGVKIVEKEVIKEVRVEVPVEKVIEKEIIKEVPVEVIKEVEVVKEVIKEVEKIVEIENTEKIDELLLKIQQLEKDLKKKPKTVTKKVEVEVPVEVVKEVYITDDEQVNKLGGKLAELEKEKQKFSTKNKELTKKVQKFSTKMEEMDVSFQEEVIRYDTQISELILKIDEYENEKSELERKLSDMEILLEKKPKEVIREVEVIKEVKSAGSPEKLKALQETIQKLRDQIREKDKSISQYEKIMLDLDNEFKNQRATFLGSTNLNNELKRRK